MSATEKFVQQRKYSTCSLSFYKQSYLIWLCQDFRPGEERHLFNKRKSLLLSKLAPYSGWTRESSLKGMYQYIWLPCTFHTETLFFFYTKQPIFLRRSTVLKRSLSVRVPWSNLPGCEWQIREVSCGKAARKTKAGHLSRNLVICGQRYQTFRLTTKWATFADKDYRPNLIF